jgi:hypothetical protein
MNIQERSKISTLIVNYYIQRVNSLNRQILAIEPELRNYRSDHFYNLKKAKVRYENQLIKCEKSIIEKPSDQRE